MNSDMLVAHRRLATALCAVIDFNLEEHRLEEIDEQSCIVQSAGTVIAVVGVKDGIHALDAAERFAMRKGLPWDSAFMWSTGAFEFGIAEDLFGNLEAGLPVFQTALQLASNPVSSDP